jgi:8-oxo-dGTP pyrophosphatase MutT (NUDIX family)
MPQPDAPDAYPMTLGEEPRFCPGCGSRSRLDVCPRTTAAPRLPRRPHHLAQPAGRGRHAPVEGGRVYLARRAIEPAKGRWTYPGGFLEVGEAAQEGARRETEEETELRVEVGRSSGSTRARTPGS